jgi:hypothetical protein
VFVNKPSSKLFDFGGGGVFKFGWFYLVF